MDVFARLVWSVSAVMFSDLASLFVLSRRIVIGVVDLPNFSTTWVTKACASFAIQPRCFSHR